MRRLSALTKAWQKRWNFTGTKKRKLCYNNKHERLYRKYRKADARK